MNLDLELDGWQRQWQAASPPESLDVRARVARDTRRKQIAVAAPVLVTIVLGGGALVRAGSARTEDLVLAAATWGFLAIAWAAALWMARGTWRPLSESTAAFVNLSVRRCESSLRAVPFAAALYLTELAFVMAWFAVYLPDAPGAWLTSWPTVLIVWIGGPAFAVFLAVYTRRKRRELRYWLDLQAELSGARD